MHKVVKKLISADAFIVLTGATLTAFIGVTGLLVRLSSDGCLPRWLLEVNEFRGTQHRIIVLFTAVCLAVLGLTRGSTEVLAGVYSSAFVSVMTGMALCHFGFKLRCPHVWRKTAVPLWVSALAAVCTITALICQAVDRFNSFLMSVGILTLFIGLCQATIRSQAILSWLAKCGCLRDWALAKKKQLGSQSQLVYLCSGSESAEKLTDILSTYRCSSLCSSLCSSVRCLTVSLSVLSRCVAQCALVLLSHWVPLTLLSTHSAASSVCLTLSSPLLTHSVVSLDFSLCRITLSQRVSLSGSLIVPFSFCLSLGVSRGLSHSVCPQQEERDPSKSCPRTLPKPSSRRQHAH